MLCKAVKSFVSVINMRKGETVDIDTELANKLISSGYVEKLNEGDDKPVKTRKARAKKEEV